jgi:hypothetical protein
MFSQLAQDLAVTEPTTQFSAAVALSGDNSVRFSVTIVNLGSSSGMNTTLQGSNDLGFWESIGSALARTTIGTSSQESKNITFAYVRLMYATQGATTTCIISANMNTSVQ